jgi:hypothetical protein
LICAAQMLLLASLAAAIVAGCGGSGTETVTQVRTQTSAASLAKPEYIAQSDVICTEANGLIDRLNDDIDSAIQRSDYQAAADATEGAMDQIKPPYTELTSLPPPEGDEEIVAKLNDSRAQIVALIERLADALRSEDNARISALATELKSAGDQVSGIATGYGFKVCGQD